MDTQKSPSNQSDMEKEKKKQQSQLNQAPWVQTTLQSYRNQSYIHFTEFIDEL